MPGDGEIVRRSLDFQARARDLRMMDLPGYMAWSERKLAEKESESLIAHLDATIAGLLPEEAAMMTEHNYNEMFEELKIEIEKGNA